MKDLRKWTSIYMREEEAEGDPILWACLQEAPVIVICQAVR